MESRRMTTRSSRRSTTLPVSPIKQAVLANVMQGTGKGSTRRSSRKVLADKTNATAVTGLVPTKSPEATTVADATVTIKAGVEVVSSCLNLQSPEQQPVTPVVVRGDDLLRSLAHGNLAIAQTPDGLERWNPEAETPQFGIPAALSPQQGRAHESEEAAPDVEVSTPPQQGEIVDARPPVEASTEITAMSERLSTAWVGCDVEEVTEVGEDDDSDCSVLVNVSSPGMHLAASPAPATSIHPTTPADFKWQRRDQSLKLKGQDIGSFSYYGGDHDYEGCDEDDEAEDYDGEVVDCEEICQGISRMGVAEAAAGLPEHKGRHIRFNYNSDDEIDVEEVDVTRLRGLPSPRGKHLRFPEDQEVSTP